jgi:hypothetical protein
MPQMIRISRSDGVAWMDRRQHGMPKGYGISNEVPDRAEAERAMTVMEELFSRFPANPV